MCMPHVNTLKIMEIFSMYLKAKSWKLKLCTAMGYQNAKKVIYSETLYKTESLPKKFQQHNALEENLRGWGGSDT